MPTLSYPGVYVQEIPSGVRPLDIASTSTAAFVGLTEMGPDTGATLVTSWTEFQRHFGSYIADSFLPQSVFQYFNNGGRQCYLVRVTRTDAVTATSTVNNRVAAKGWKFSAGNDGVWGNSLLLQLEDGGADPGNTFKLTVRRLPDPTNAPANPLDLSPLETFDNLGVDPTAANFAGAVLAANSLLVTAELAPENRATQNGVHIGGIKPSVALGANRSFQISLNGDGYQTVTLPDAALADAEAAALAIKTAVHTLHPLKASTDPNAFIQFDCTAENAPTGPDKQLMLKSGTDAANSSVQVRAAASNDATTLLKIGSAGRSENGLAVRRPVNVAGLQVGNAVAAAAATPGTNGAAEINGAAAINELSFAAAFSRLDNISDFSLLAVPGEGTTAMFDLGTAYCANRPLQDAFYIGEMAADDDSADEAAGFRGRLTTANSYGALYFPWVRSLDPSGQSQSPVLLPPSGYLAGLYARIDGSRGVWKAPAGTEASLNGVVGLATELTDTQQGNLNPIGVDVLRRFPGAGVVAFGARTISADPEWRYVPVRRTAIMLRTSIYHGIQFAVFEPNDETLWAQLRLSIGSFMLSLFRQGAFQGSTPSRAFFVKVDKETTTQADIDAGVVNVLVGFAPLKPAEFVVVKISQQAGLAAG